MPHPPSYTNLGISKEAKVALDTLQAYLSGKKRKPVTKSEAIIIALRELEAQDTIGDNMLSGLVRSVRA